jgi:hypothetical protein
MKYLARLEQGPDAHLRPADHGRLWRERGGRITFKMGWAIRAFELPGGGWGGARLARDRGLGLSRPSKPCARQGFRTLAPDSWAARDAFWKVLVRSGSPRAPVVWWLRRQQGRARRGYCRAAWRGLLCSSAQVDPRCDETLADCSITAG